MSTKICVVGGGSGGTIVANRLADNLRPELEAGDVEVVVLNDTSYQLYRPATLYMAFGRSEVSEVKRPVEDLLDPRVKFRQKKAVSIDPDTKTLDLASGETCNYDYAVLTTGSKLAMDEVPGLKEAGHHFYGPEGSEELREKLANFDSGRIVVSVIGVPHMCPVAPMEFSFLADDWFRKRGKRDEVEIVYTYPINGIFGFDSIANWARPLMEERDIKTETLFNPDEIDPEEKVMHTAEGTEMEFDLLVAIPPHKGDDLIKSADLGDGEWIETNQYTLEAARAEDVYAIGDAADVPTSKAGSVAHYESGVVADRLASQARGQTPTARYEGKTICFIDGVDGNKATFLEFEYSEEPEVPKESKLIHWAKHSYNEAYWLTAKGLL
ncbi:NAD(P)/FAD-dependent oxidoreductase [Candidatus Bipolaricaulota bacterium]|nr:NAD(P)/FAD-dependent oxidoreductase [Candidatus Bipolaricaulota bacterium]